MVDTIKKLCKTKNMTLKDLEKSISVANSSIRRWDKSIPNIGSVSKVAEFFGVSIDFIYYGGEIKTTPQDDRESMIIESFRKCDEKGKAKITQVTLNEMERTEREHSATYSDSAG